jgi:hypothetical protein
MTRSASVIGSAIVVCLLCGAEATAQPGSLVLEQIAPPVELRSGSNAAVPLDSQKDKGRVLKAGDVLTCKTSTAWFTVLDGSLEERKIDRCTNGFVVPTPAGKAVAVLERYGRTGGRSRGSMLGLLLWPVTGVRTLPSTASQLQWRKQSGGTAAATLKEAGSDRVLWTRSGIDAALGTLHDPDLESALRAQADAGKTNPVLELRISDALAASATIALLDRAGDQKLQQQLAAAAALGDAARHLARADVFLEGNLPREALDEYMALLERSPESTMLLTKASAIAVEISDPRGADLVKRARAAGGS